MRRVGLAVFASALVFLLVARLRPPAVKHNFVRFFVKNNQVLLLAPDLTLTDLSGNTLKTASLKGNVIVVNFWAAWCTPCAEETPKFISLQQRYKSQGLEIIGVSIDDQESELRDFCRRSRVNYPVIAGSQEIAQAYGGILGLPTTFIIGRDGRIQKKLTGETDFAALQQDVDELLERK